jgi:hypothetical protein
MNSGNGTITKITSAGNAVNLTNGATSNTIRGLTIGSTTGIGINGTNFGTLTVADADMSDTAARTGQALSLTTGTIAATFANIISTNSAATGITLSGVAGSLTVNTNTTIGNPTGIGISVGTSSATLSFGTTSSTGSGGTGISLLTNTGAITFGALTITPDANQRGLLATDNTNTITIPSGTIATSGAIALEITRSSSTTPLTVSLTSVSANGGANGIKMTNTSGTFTVTGDGTQTSGLYNRNGTGGTIQSTSNDGVLLSNASNVTLRQMNITNAGWDGVQSTGGSNIVLSATDINHPGNANPDSAGGTGNPSGFGGGNGWYAENITGTNRFDNNSRVFNWQASQSNGVLIHSTGTNFTSFTVDHVLISTSATAAAGIHGNLNGATTGQVSITNSEFTLIDQNAAQIFNNGSGTVRAIVQGNNFHDADATSGDGNNTLYLTNSANGALNFTIGGAGALGNTFKNLARLTTLAGVIQVDAAGGNSGTPNGGTINGTIENNNISNDAGFVNGRRGIDIQVEMDSHNLGTLVAAI